MSQVNRNGSSGNRKSVGKEYWRSLDELADTSAFKAFYEREFQDGAAELDANGRRTFLKIMGASLALAGVGLTSCRTPEEHIAPYAHRPEGVTPGKSRFFATTMEYGGVGHGLLAKSYDGRPIKLEGNPSHPINRAVYTDFDPQVESQKGIDANIKHGASTAIEQASLLELYDPDRSKSVMNRTGGKNKKATFAEFESYFEKDMSQFKARYGAGLYFLSESTSSPSVLALKKRTLEAFPEARWFDWEALSFDNELLANEISYGKKLRTHLMLRRTNLIVSFGSDFLNNHPSSIRYAQDFAAKRDPDHDMTKLVVFESDYSVTGANADARLAVKPSDVTACAAAVALELIKLGAVINLGSQFIPKLKAVAREYADHEFIKQTAKELNGNRGISAVVCGQDQPIAAHVIVNAINDGIYNNGEMILYTESPDADRISHLDSITMLSGDMNAEKVLSLVIIGGNPVYDAPPDLDFYNGLSKVDNSYHLSLYDNETSHACNWHIPRAHFLESWSDSRAYIGNYCITQPIIAPLYGGITSAELLAHVLRDSTSDARAITRRTFYELHIEATGGDVERTFNTILSEGVNPRSFYRPVSAMLTGNSWVRELDRAPRAQKDAVEIHFRSCPKMYDGRFANNGWLQELPDPITKLTWDNAAHISPTLAEKFKLKTGNVIEIEYSGRNIETPVFVVPGHSPDSITLTIGYGRTYAGIVGNGVGVNVYPLRTSKAQFYTNEATVKTTRRRVKLATTQDHHAIDVEKLGSREVQRRLPALVREADLEHYKEHPDFAKHVVHHPPLESLWREHEYDGHKWGMVIDLNACIGCGACSIACQAENNIPVVGKDEVARGREMQWIRVDRYFKGDIDDPQAVFQPVTCHHCENAPCEQVCPVAATLHSEEGLNQMIYNRCVGTRYCSDNCPYKVRRFNFFNNHKHMTDVEKMAMNPDVTVRSRGVMEKCTFCIQRIAEVKIPAKNDGREIIDGEIVPACAQACPARAITFGDLNDPESRVTKLAAHNRSYEMLGELNIKPRLSYLAKVRHKGEATDPYLAQISETDHKESEGESKGDSHDNSTGGHGK